MQVQYHILNGDALKEQFPSELLGKVIVARECLVDGDVQGDELSGLFKNRARFISNSYAGYSEKDYYDKTVSEFRKIQDIPNGADITLWFEDDLFCQVNLWFTIHLLLQLQQENSIFLVRPQVQNQYGFGGSSSAELLSAYEDRIELVPLEQLASLWRSYQLSDTASLLDTAKELGKSYPFILPAVLAHIERIPSADSLGRPTVALVEIMKELDTDQFAPIFSEFSKRESIYGFGDLQVKRLLDEIVA